MRRLIVTLFGSFLGGTLFSSCTLTGDPSTGGIFWSESKAQARQQAMLSELDAKKGQLNSLERKHIQLRHERDSL